MLGSKFSVNRFFPGLDRHPRASVGAGADFDNIGLKVLPGHISALGDHASYLVTLTDGNCYPLLPVQVLCNPSTTADERACVL